MYKVYKTVKSNVKKPEVNRSQSRNLYKLFAKFDF